MFHSCKSWDDQAARHNVVKKSPFLSRSHSMPAAPLLKPLPQPSICKLRTPPSLHINNTCILSSKEARSFVPLSRKSRASIRKSKLKSKSKFHVSPVEHFTYRHPFYDLCGTWYYSMGNDCGKKKKRRRNKPKEARSFVPLSRKSRASTRKSKLKLKSKFPVSPVEHFTYRHPFYDRCGTWYYAVGNDCGKTKKRRRRNKPKGPRS